MSLRINSLYTSAGGAIRLAVGVLTAPLLVRLLGLEGFGAWAVLSAVAGIAVQMEFGIPAAVNTLMASDVALEDKERTNQTAVTSILLTTAFGLLTTLVLLVAAPFLTRALFPGNPSMEMFTTALRVLSVSIVIRFWQALAAGLEGALQRYDLQTLVELPSSLAIQLGWLGAAALGGGILSMAWVQLAVVAASCVAHGMLLYKIWPALDAPASWSRTSANRLLRFGFAQWLTALGAALFNQADRVIVNVVLGPAVTGVYSAVTSVANKIVEVTVLPLRVLPPAVSAAATLKDFDRVRYLFGQAVRVNGALSFMCASVLLFFADPLMQLIIGPGPATAAYALRAVAMIYAFNSLCITSAWFVFGLARPAILARWALTGTFLMGISIWFLASVFGLTGAVWGNAAYLITVMITVELARLLDMPAKRALMAFAPSALALGFCWALASLPVYTGLPLVARAAIFAIVAPACLVFITGWKALCELVSSSLAVLRSAGPGSRTPPSILSTAAEPESAGLGGGGQL